MKDYRKNELRDYILANILLILFTSNIISEFNYKISEAASIIGFILETSVVLSIIYSYTFILDSFISPNIKDKIIYFFTKRPGETIFTDIQKDNYDYRFTSVLAKDKYKDIYSEIENMDEVESRKVQNSKWYSIYLNYRNDEAIALCQKDYLTNRDLCVCTLTMIVIYLLVSAVFCAINFRLSMLVILFIEFIITIIAANLKARRFVSSVIAKDIHSK